MPALTLKDFTAGMDSRAAPEMLGAARFELIENAYVTSGRAIRKRPGTHLFETLGTDLHGPFLVNGRLHFFTVNTAYGAAGTVNPVILQGSVAVMIAVLSPSNIAGSPPPNGISAAIGFSGSVYVVVNYFISGQITTLHHYFGALGAFGTLITDPNCPHFATSVVNIKNKLYAPFVDVVRYCANGNPRDWTTANDAGFLPVANSSPGSTQANAVGIYQDRLVVFFEDVGQVWNVDPNPALNSLEKTFTVGVHLFGGQAIRNVGSELYFFSAQNRIHSLSVMASEYGFAIESDIGGPVDALLGSFQYTQYGATPAMLHFRQFDQLWVIVSQAFPGFYAPANVFVLSLSKMAKVTAWSHYTFTQPMINFAEAGGLLYARHPTNGNLFRIDPADATDFLIAGTTFPVSSVIKTANLDFGAPGVLKQITGMDAVVRRGTARIKLRVNEPGNVYESDELTFTADTRTGGLSPVEVCATSVQVEINHQFPEAFELSAITLYYQTLGVV